VCSSAEVDWAMSSNRLVEKVCVYYSGLLSAISTLHLLLVGRVLIISFICQVEDEADANEDVLRINRPKRRLILTTQLMQQVFRSPSPAALSLIASSNYETIVYSLARLTLGDACGLVCCSESDSPVDLGCGSL